MTYVVETTIFVRNLDCQKFQQKKNIEKIDSPEPFILLPGFCGNVKSKDAIKISKCKLFRMAIAQNSSIRMGPILPLPQFPELDLRKAAAVLAVLYCSCNHIVAVFYR